MCLSRGSGLRFVDDDLPHLLVRAAHAVSGGSEAELRRRGITLPVWRVLAALSDSPGAPTSRLAETCLFQQPTMTKLLNRMERNGLVRRHGDQHDRRIVHVALTPEGEALATDLMGVAQRYEADLLARHPRAAGIKEVLRDLIADRGRSPRPEG